VLPCTSGAPQRQPLHDRQRKSGRFVREVDGTASMEPKWHAVDLHTCLWCSPRCLLHCHGKFALTRMQILTSTQLTFMPRVCAGVFPHVRQDPTPQTLHGYQSSSVIHSALGEATSCHPNLNLTFLNHRRTSLGLAEGRLWSCGIVFPVREFLAPTCLRIGKAARSQYVENLLSFL